MNRDEVQGYREETKTLVGKVWTVTHRREVAPDEQHVELTPEYNRMLFAGDKAASRALREAFERDPHCLEKRAKRKPLTAEQRERRRLASLAGVAARQAKRMQERAEFQRKMDWEQTRHGPGPKTVSVNP